MIKNLLLSSLLMLVSIFTFAQIGEIQGKVNNVDTGEPVPFANISITINGTLSGATTDFDGFYTLKPVPPGTYDIEVSFVGLQSQKQTGVLVIADKITFLDFDMREESELLEEFEVIEYRIPLLKADETSTGKTMTKEDIAKLPTRNVQSIASQTAGVYQADEGGAVNVKGSRSDATDYYIDGIKVRGTSALPASAIEQISVVTGGVPARYGDATGGIINITTRGPSNQFAGSVEALSSQFTDPFDYNLFNFTVGGPIVRANKGEAGERAVVGFLLSGEYLSQGDDDPSAVGVPKVNDAVLAEIEQNPLLRSESASGFLKRVDFVNSDEIERIDARVNNGRETMRLAGKMDFQPVRNINLILGGNLNTTYQRFDISDRRYEMFNFNNNPERQDNTYRGYARFTQRFSTANVEGEKASILQNAFYTLQFDYTKNNRYIQDFNFKDNYFNYGYVGKFDTYREPVYFQGEVGNLQGWQLQGYSDTLVNFTPSDINPIRSRHNEQYFELAGDDQDNFYTNLNQIILNGGLWNGTTPASLSSAYSLYSVPGTPYNYTDRRDDDQYRLTFNSAFDFKPPGSSERNKHAIEFGFEYEQRVDRFWFMNPVGLWDVMFQEIASFGNEIVRDLDNPILVIDGEQIPFSEYNGIDNVFNTNDTITYNLVRSGEQTYFDKQFRDRFGYGLTDFVDVFSVDPSQLSLDLFAPDDLWREGNELLSYRGYDYLGTKLTNQPAFEDFWTAKDANGNYTRPIDAARPIYMAGFIQDKFSFRDLIFNIGVRVDRFDANQKVPKDAFSPLYATRSAGEINLSDFNIDNVPSTIGDDFVVYVDDEINPSKIIGYRNPNADLQGEWYNSNGLLITDIQSLQEEVGGNLKPYLAAPLSDNPISDIQNENYDPKLAFEDYEPQITVAPRIAFSFNISDEAIFFAHYDVLSQRPQGRLITSPEDYFFMPNRVGTTINNASLKPERTIDYQIGFKQKLGNTSALTVAGFYRELKDMVQLTQVRFAYPFTYSTYGNIDFGTVKGLELTYDLRRTGNVRMTASYTLQFADATASGDEAPVSLVDFGVPNLRSTFPVNWDARHTLNMNMDYRFGEGRDYNGPELFGAKIFQNAGLNLTMRARSGTPFGRQDNPTPTAQFGVASRANLDGNPNGSRLPWNFVINGRLDKDFKLQFSQAENAKAHYINLYVQVQNLLDADNIQGVYAFTGSPDDDGFVLSPEGQEVIINQTDVQAFSDQYNSKVLDPNNFSLPRTVRLGLRFDF